MKFSKIARLAAGALIATAICAAAPCAIAQADEPVSIKINAAGDCTLGTDSGFNYSTSLNAMASAKGRTYFLREVKWVFEKDDLTIVNLEGTLTKRGSRANKTFAFRGNPNYTKILTSSGVEAVTFANNHAYDYGEVSHTDTLKYVKKAGLKCASYSQVTIYKTKGKRIGIVAVNDIGGPGDCKTLIKNGISKLKKKYKADLLIVAIHAGIEREHYANTRQESLAHYAVDCGANLVLGTHPHVLQGVECYKGAYIAYSMGNFCFGGNSNPSDKDTMIFQQTFNWNSKGKLKKDNKVRVIAASVSGHTSYNDYQPRLLYKSDRTRVINRINTYSKKYGVKFNSKGWVKK